MLNNCNNGPPNKNQPNHASIDVHIEVSKGSREKYEYDDIKNRMMLDRILPTGIHYPYNYGYIPDTLGNDGDPLDVIVITQMSLAPMTWATVRIVGYLDMEDEKGRDEKLIGYIANEAVHSHIDDLSKVPQCVLDEISHFFETYKSLENNKWSKVHQWHDRHAAKSLIEQCSNIA